MSFLYKENRHASGKLSISLYILFQPTSKAKNTQSGAKALHFKQSKAVSVLPGFSVLL
jgi:hypothetical protein